MVGDVKEGQKWRAFVFIWLIVLPTEVLADDEADIRNAYSEYQKTLLDFRVNEPNLNVAIGLEDFLAQTIRQAYGSEPFSPQNASLMTGYGVGLIRGLILCSYMSDVSNEVIDLVRTGAPVTALTILRNWNPVPWWGSESFGPVTVYDDRAKMEFHLKAYKKDQSGKAISFTDYIEFRRIDGRWKLDFNSIISMADRNASAVAASGSAPRGGEGRRPGEVGLEIAYISSVLYTVPRCSDSLPSQDRPKDGVVDAVFRASVIAVGTPIRYWPDKDAAAWGKL